MPPFHVSPLGDGGWNIREFQPWNFTVDNNNRRKGMQITFRFPCDDGVSSPCFGVTGTTIESGRVHGHVSPSRLGTFAFNRTGYSVRWHRATKTNPYRQPYPSPVGVVLLCCFVAGCQTPHIHTSQTAHCITLLFIHKHVHTPLW